MGSCFDNPAPIRRPGKDGIICVAPQRAGVDMEKM